LGALLVNRLGDQLFLSKNGPMLARLPDLDSDWFFTHGQECGWTGLCKQQPEVRSEPAP
jgi:hypothetical protein